MLINSLGDFRSRDLLQIVTRSPGHGLSQSAWQFQHKHLPANTASQTVSCRQNRHISSLAGAYLRNLKLAFCRILTVHSKNGATE